MVQRLVLGLLTLLVFVTFLFVLAKVLIPGDFVTQFQFSLSLEEREALREGLGLTQPIWRQYLSFVGSLLTGDLGTSYYGNPVSSHIWFDTQATVLMFMTGMGVAYVAGQWMGRVAAWRSSSRWSNAIAFGSVMTYTVFPVFSADPKYFKARKKAQKGWEQSNLKNLLGNGRKPAEEKAG